MTISSPPVKYINLGKFGNGFIWKPVGGSMPLMFSHIGLIYSPTEPKLEDYRVVDANYLVRSSNYLEDNFCKCELILSNQYNMFVRRHDTPLSVDSIKVKFNSFTFDNNIDNKKLNENTKNNTEHFNSVGDTSHRAWKNKYGKFVVLVASDNPWFHNSENSEPVKLETSKTNIHPHQTDYYKPFGAFSYDKSVRQSIGTQPRDGIEYFSNTKIEMSNEKLIYCVLFTILVSQLVYIFTYSHK
jgi:hypothetical protein